jgi:hypothetical protein
MSGVVINLNEEDEEEDVAGLLASVEEVDEDDFGGDGLGLPESNAKRNKKGRSFGRRVKSKPYTVVRGGTVGYLLSTLTICCLFFGIVRQIF